MEAQKTILVTGGAGFIGSHLIEALLQCGHAVISLDNYSSGSTENHREGATYIRGETSDIESLVSGPVDLVYHLGEYSRVEASFGDVEKVWQYNIRGTHAVLEYCRTRMVKIVYAGSSTKFGDGGLARDSSPYAWSKAVNSELVANYGAWFGLPHAIAYFYNVYGPREIQEGSYATIIGIFRKQREQGKKLTVVSPGTQKRNFTHVDDIVAGLLAVGEEGSGDGYGLGSHESYSILDIAKLFNADVEMLPERAGNRMDSAIDTTKVEAQFGWKTEKRVEDYIKEFLSTLS